MLPATCSGASTTPSRRIRNETRFVYVNSPAFAGLFRIVSIFRYARPLITEGYTLDTLQSNHTSMNRIQTIVSSAVITTLFAVAPFAASADTLGAKASTGVFINPDGIVRVIGASVTAVSGDVVTAVTSIGSVVLNWAVNVSDSTKVAVNGAVSTSTAGIKAGDKISFMGSLSSSVGTSLSVAATKIRDLADFSVRHIGAGTVSSVNSANGSFVLTSNNRTVTVQTTASTTITVSGVTSNFASLAVNQKAVVAGVANADGSVITATTVTVRPADQGKNDKEQSGKNESHGIRARLNFLGGFHFGKED